MHPSVMSSALASLPSPLREPLARRPAHFICLTFAWKSRISRAPTLSITHALSPCLTGESSWRMKRRKYYSQPQASSFHPARYSLFDPSSHSIIPLFHEFIMRYALRRAMKNDILKHLVISMHSKKSLFRVHPKLEESLKSWLLLINARSIFLLSSLFLCFAAVVFPTFPLRAHSERSEYYSEVKNRI